MICCPFRPSRTGACARAALAAALVGAAGATVAGDPPARSPAASASSATAPIRGAAAADAAAARPDPSVPLPIDPMEVLREKLAERLGGRSVGPGEAPYDLRVVTRTPAPPPTTRPRATATRTGGGAAAATAAGAADVGASPATTWSYEGATGPERWGSLRTEWAACGSGQRQSPIDLRGGIAVELEPLGFDYRPGSFSVTDTGRTVRVDVEAGSVVRAVGRRYELQHVEFRRPAEERIDGRTFEMSAQLVHRDAQGRLAVVSVLFERGPANPAVQSIWTHLPLEKGEAWPAPVALDLASLLPPDRRYATYMGSLTTPPCTEGVLRMVLLQPVPLSEAQIGVFAYLYPMNARPLQAAHGRLVKRSP